LNLEQIIASTCRQKILRALSNVKRTHITGLVRTINSTFNEVRRNLEILQDEGIVKITSVGSMKMVELQRDSQKTEKLLEVLRTLEHERLRTSEGEDAREKNRRRTPTSSDSNSMQCHKGA
jgi:DeoR/GlpR family transcriptional regulator of sugar metabolism